MPEYSKEQILEMIRFNNDKANQCLRHSEHGFYSISMVIEEPIATKIITFHTTQDEKALSILMNCFFDLSQHYSNQRRCWEALQNGKNSG